MNQNKFGQLVFTESDVFDLVMQGRDHSILNGMTVDESVKLDCDLIDSVFDLRHPEDNKVSVEEFHRAQQRTWHMPEEYKNLDIAEHVLSLCQNQEELQRCGAELLMYQERDLFDLLRYLKYLVDVMSENQIIWGVGRGSSVASFVLYKLGVHRINSMYYELDPEEFLR